MADILEAVQHFFDEEAWIYREIPGGLLVQFGGSNGEWPCFARAREAEGQLIFYSYAPVTLDATQIPPVIEYISRANFGLFVGNFELDYNSGTLQFRTSIDVEGQEEALSSRLIRHLVYQNVLTMDRYLPGLRLVLDNSLSPEEAIHQTEA